MMTMPHPLSQRSIKTLKGVGEVLYHRLLRLSIHTVQDLLFHLPLRYEDRSKIYPINTLSQGMYATIEGQIIHSEIVITRRRTLLCRINDGTGIVTLRFMHFNAGMATSLKADKFIRAYGEIKRGQQSLEIIHPQYTLYSQLPADNKNEQNHFTPIYPTTDGIHQKTFRQLMIQALSLLQRFPLENTIPQTIKPVLMDINQALITLHQPDINTDLELIEKRKHPAQQRLIIEELLAHNLSMQFLRTDYQQKQAVPLQQGVRIDQLLASLPFTLTQAQLRTFNEIAQDLNKMHPMMRLVQGDVGSGKTLVAALSALMALESGYQVVLMAPTELLAEQHLNNFKYWLEPLGFTVGWLVGKQKGKVRQNELDRIKNGELQMVIGTHALFQENVQFKHVALIIIDEQHRFGVTQRLMLWEKGLQQNNHPHQLFMTATPIPRTLAMTAYADLDTSIIDELPPGRTPVSTVAIPQSRRQEVIERVNQACLEQRQVYWVCTLIEESEVLEAQAAQVTFDALQEQLPNLRIGLIHGKMKPQEKQEIMQQFKDHQLQLLVATTVIEVGVDVPNASLMIIENPERLGLAQLHQLRGRVGRGTAVSHCVLLYQVPLSKTAKQRLQVLRESQDGFYIAEQDIAIRGAGEILGTRQTGSIGFKIADLDQDQALLPVVQTIAKTLNQYYPKQAHSLVNYWLPQKNRYINT